MYERFFGFRERPFDLTPNPRYLYLTGRHREALSNLRYGITGRKGITLLIGEAGTGKTTLVRAAIEASSGQAIRIVYLSNPALTRAEFYEFLAPKFGLSDRAAASKARFLAELEEVLLARFSANETMALIIDEAQSLPRELMEEVRLLANIETATEKLLPVVLAGQPELAVLLEREDLRQLKQRIALRCDLLPLDIHETAAYISGRIVVAGGESANVFTREAVRTIYERSLGIPRTISVICDNALLTGFAAGLKPVGSDTVIEVCRDFNLPAPRPSPGNGHAAMQGESDRKLARRPPLPLRPLVPLPAGAGGVALPARRPGPPPPQPQAEPVEAATPAVPRAAAVGAEPAKARQPVQPEVQPATPPVGRPEPPERPLFGHFTKAKRFKFF